MNQDPEIIALSKVYDSLKILNKTQIKRIIDWISSKFTSPEKRGGDEVIPPGVPLYFPPGETAEPITEPVKKRRGRQPKLAVPIDEPVKKRRGRQPKLAVPTAEPVKKRRGRQPKLAVPSLQPETESPGMTVFGKYDSIKDLFFNSNVKTETAKILLVAAYLQEKFNKKELTSHDVNVCLDQVGEGLHYINIPINALLEKNPPLLVQVGKIGNYLKAKKKFRVTEEGLRIAQNYINE